MTYIEDDASFYQADLGLDWSQFFDHTFSFRDEDFEVQFIDPCMPACNAEELSIQSLQCCDNDLDRHTSGHSGWIWNGAATEDPHAKLQGSHASIASDTLADNWPGDMLLANPISQQELKPTTPYSISSTSPSSIDVPVVRPRRRSRPYSCTSCSKTFAFPKDLRRHRLTHSDSKPHRCPVHACRYHQQGFSRKDNCSRHVQRAHPEISQSLRQISPSMSPFPPQGDVSWETNATYASSRAVETVR